jgi:hypothetical protein
MSCNREGDLFSMNRGRVSRNAISDGFGSNSASECRAVLFRPSFAAAKTQLCHRLRHLLTDEDRLYPGNRRVAGYSRQSLPGTLAIATSGG